MDNQLQQNLLDIFRNAVPMILMGNPNWKNVIIMNIVPILIALYNYFKKRTIGLPSIIPVNYKDSQILLDDFPTVSEGLQCMLEDKFQSRVVGPNNRFKFTRMDLTKVVLKDYELFLTTRGFYKMVLEKNMQNIEYFINVVESFSSEDKKSCKSKLTIYSKDIETCNFLIKILSDVGAASKDLITYSGIYSETVCNEQKLRTERYQSVVYKTFDNIFISQKNKDQLVKCLDMLKHNKSIMIERGLPLKKTILISGPPGNGKTSVAYAIARYMNYSFAKVDLKNMTNQNFAETFNRTKHVFLLDEIDKYDFILKKECLPTYQPPKGYENYSHMMSNSGKNNKELSDYTWREIMDANNHLQECIVVITTNHPENLDPTNVRDGRIDLRLEFDNCSTEQFNKIFEFYYQRSPPIEFKFPDNQMSIATLVYTHILQNLENSQQCIASIDNFIRNTSSKD